jgi:hypothetical protein
MGDKRTTAEEMRKRAVYAQAITIQSVARPATVAETAEQRTVVTSLTEGIISLRYAPRTPKPAEPVDTDA